MYPTGEATTMTAGVSYAHVSAYSCTEGWAVTGTDKRMLINLGPACTEACTRWHADREDSPELIRTMLLKSGTLTCEFK